MAISQNFENILAKQTQIGYRYPSLLNPPASKDKILFCETKIGFKFNPELLELYSFADGNTTKNLPLGQTGLIPLYQFLSLEDAASTYLMYRNGTGFTDLFTEWHSGYKPGESLFPILTDGAGNHYWVDLNEGSSNYGRIYWTNTYPSSPGYAFHSLSLMFQTIEAAYKTDIFFVDADGYLEEDLERWNELASKMNPNLVIWTE